MRKLHKNSRYKIHSPISYELVYEFYLRYVETKNEVDLKLYQALVKVWNRHLKEHNEFNYSHL